MPETQSLPHPGACAGRGSQFCRNPFHDGGDLTTHRLQVSCEGTRFRQCSSALCHSLDQRERTGIVGGTGLCDCSGPRLEPVGHRVAITSLDGCAQFALDLGDLLIQLRQGGAQRPGTVLGSARGGLGSAERLIGCTVEREPFAGLSLVGHEHFGGVQATHQALPRCLLVFQNGLKTLSRTELSTLEKSDGRQSD